MTHRYGMLAPVWPVRKPGARHMRDAREAFIKKLVGLRSVRRVDELEWVPFQWSVKATMDIETSNPKRWHVRNHDRIGEAFTEALRETAPKPSKARREKLARDREEFRRFLAKRERQRSKQRGAAHTKA